MQLVKYWCASIDDYVIDLGWSADGSLLAAASAAGPLSLFSAAEGAARFQLPGHESGTNVVSWHPHSQLLASGGQDGTAKIWDASAGQHVGTFRAGDDWVEHLAWSPGAPCLLACTSGRKLSLIKPDASLVHSFAQSPKSLTALAWHPKGGCVASAYFGGVCLWDSGDFKAQKEYAYGNGIQALVWSPDGRWLVSGNQDPSVHLWVPEEDVELQMSGYDGKVRHLSFDHSSRWLATSGGADACIWDCQGAGPEGRDPAMLPHSSPVSAVSFQHARGLLATASDSGEVMIWSPERRQPLRATVKMPAAATRLAWSPDDRLLAIGSAQGIVYVLRCES